MSRKFEISPGCNINKWYDPKTKTWFIPGKVIEVDDNEDFGNINVFLARNFIYEVFDELPLTKDPLIKSTTSKILASERKIKEVVVPNIQEVEQFAGKLVGIEDIPEVKIPEGGFTKEEIEKVAEPIREVVASNLIEDDNEKNTKKKRGPKKKAE